MITDAAPVPRVIEAQHPHSPPYAEHVDHGLTSGWLLGEVIHQVGGTIPGADDAHRVGFADRSDQPGESGDARVRDLTRALGSALGA